MRPLALQRAFPNLSFSQLTNLAQPKGESGRLFVTEQRGKVWGFPHQEDAAQPELFLDLTGLVSQGHNEEGLLGLAFDPAFQQNGHFFVYYSAAEPRRSVLSRFSVSGSDPNKADKNSELVVMEIPQPAGNHNGGQLAFGADGYLYVGLGDGGGSGDPYGNGQDLSTLLGSILRIDISEASKGKPYTVPPDNPFVGNAAARGEIWAYGLRNPWRFSFDTGSGATGPGSSGYGEATTGQLWVGDVGQNLREEINLVQKGLNYGWNLMEGTACFPSHTECGPAGLELPVAEYGRNAGCSVIGGYVYRGRSIPSLFGAYVFGDYCSGSIWAVRLNEGSGPEQLLLVDSQLNITSFGKDQSGEIYILSRNSGIYQLVARN